MTREEGIHKLKIVKKTECIGCSHRDNGEYCEKVCGIPEALGMAIDALEAQQSKEDTTKGTTFVKWVSCSERLPEEINKEYLVTVKYNDALGDEIITSSSDYYFSYGWDDYGKEVIAWAELPEPYKEEQS